MPGRNKSNRRPPNRTSTRKNTSPPPLNRSSGETDDLPEAELLKGLDEALRDPNPLALLTLASGLMSALDPRGRHPMAPAPTPPLPTLTEFCDALLETGFRQTDALLLLFGTLSRDELMRKRIQRTVAERRHAVPGWLLRLDQVEVGRAVEMVHVLRDGDNVALEVQLPGRRECTILVYIDHNLGTVVKDAFILDRPLDDVIEAWQGQDPGDDTAINELPGADARARIAPAIDLGAITFPPFETETWPMCRPLTEWVVSLLPEGGTGYVRPEWTEDQLAALTEDFFGSPFAAGLDDEDHRSLMESILWFGTDYGPGDPLRWSPVSVEILLDDWIPRKLIAPSDYLIKAPDLIRAFVRYAHAERGVSGQLTAETLEVIDDLEPEYRAVVRSPRPQGPLAVLESLGNFNMDYEEYMLGDLAASVGGPLVLDSLDAKPLPDEPLETQGIPDDVRERVLEVSELVDGCCDALFDRELRTAGRRFIALVATADPEIFRRRGSTRTAAAAACWALAKANDRFDLYGPETGGGVRVKDLMAYFGLTGSVSQRAEVMLRAIGAGISFSQVQLRNPALLVSDKRADIIGLRDRLRETSD